jgi:hypothetical protein
MGNDVLSSDILQTLSAKGLFIKLPEGVKSVYYEDGHAALVPKLKSAAKHGLSKKEVRMPLQHCAARVRRQRCRTRVCMCVRVLASVPSNTTP